MDVVGHHVMRMLRAAVNTTKRHSHAFRCAESQSKKALTPLNTWGLLSATRNR
jgi:hypothetical protein